MGLNSLIKWLEHDGFLAIKWFENINMKLNQVKVGLSPSKTIIFISMKALLK